MLPTELCCVLQKMLDQDVLFRMAFLELLRLHSIQKTNGCSPYIMTGRSLRSLTRQNSWYSSKALLTYCYQSVLRGSHSMKIRLNHWTAQLSTYCRRRKKSF